MSQLYIHENLVRIQNPTTGSQDIVQTRKCETNADTNEICTKINMSPFPVIHLWLQVFFYCYRNIWAQLFKANDIVS